MWGAGSASTPAATAPMSSFDTGALSPSPNGNANMPRCFTAGRPMKYMKAKIPGCTYVTSTVGIQRTTLFVIQCSRVSAEGWVGWGFQELISASVSKRASSAARANSMVPWSRFGAKGGTW